MGSLSLSTRHALLTAFTGGSAYANPGIFGQLHLGDPGAAGTANPAAMTTRQQLTFGTPAASRSIATTTLTAWPAASVGETLSWWSFWSAALAGSHIANDDMNASAPVAIGENLEIAVGGMVFTITASASNLTDTVVNGMLDAVCRNQSYSNAQVWVQLHTGAPGAAGTSNIAANNTRVQVTSWNAPSGGSISNAMVPTWPAAPAAETYTDVTLWSASSGGTFLALDQLASSYVAVIGNIFTIPVGQLAIQLV